jgi:hypothetical protein
MSDWRASAYLRKENWPEAIPVNGPKREYGPYPWGKVRHEDPHNLDNYPFSHPAAASVGDVYMGDVCPRCGVPLRYDERVVTRSSRKGELHEVSPDTSPKPCYHPECWKDREAEKHQLTNTTLAEF